MLASWRLNSHVEASRRSSPRTRFLVVKSVHASAHIVGMTGDRVNDAPALRQAEVGIAVSRATDVAKGAASAVLTTEGLVNIVEVVTTGRDVRAGVDVDREQGEA